MNEVEIKSIYQSVIPNLTSYAKTKGKELGYSSYIKDEYVYFEKAGIVKVLDVEKIYFTCLSYGEDINQTYLTIEDQIKYEMISGFYEDRVLPYFVSEYEVKYYENIPYSERLDGNNIFIIDRAMGCNGKLANQNEVGEIPNIINTAFMNLDNQYTDEKICFYKSAKDDLYHIDNLLFHGIGRSAILLNEVHSAIKEQIGSDVLYLISQDENLHIFDKSGFDVHEDMSLNYFLKTWYDEGYLVLEKSVQGKFLELLKKDN